MSVDAMMDERYGKVGTPEREVLPRYRYGSHRRKTIYIRALPYSHEHEKAQAHHTSLRPATASKPL